MSLKDINAGSITKVQTAITKSAEKRRRVKSSLRMIDGIPKDIDDDLLVVHDRLAREP